MKQRKPGCYIAAVLLAGLMLGGCGNPNAKANTAESVSASDFETVSESEEIVSAAAILPCHINIHAWMLYSCSASGRINAWGMR